MNLKQRCAVCKKEVASFRLILMMGSMGYRRYKCCEKCAAKEEKKQKKGVAR